MEDDSLLVNDSVFSVKADWKSDLLHYNSLFLFYTHNVSVDIVFFNAF